MDAAFEGCLSLYRCSEGHVTILFVHLNTASTFYRSELDLDADAADKLPDLFTFSMDIKVSNDERPVRDQLSWSNWTPSSTSPLTPFSGREEYEQTLQLFGMLIALCSKCCYHVQCVR